MPDLGEQAKIFAKHGVKIEALYTSGGAETMQALIAGSVDVAISTGTAAVFAAYVKAPRFGRLQRRSRARVKFSGTSRRTRQSKR